MRLLGRKKVEEKTVATVPQKEMITEEYAKKALDMLGMTNKLSPAQKALFIQIAVSQQLDPLNREIHAQPRGETMNIVVGYEVYIDRAGQTGLLEDWWLEDEGELNGGTYAATVCIKRRDRAQVFKWKAWYTESKQGGPIWSQKPRFMTGKTAISQGFRLCFRDVLKAMPYTAEEMPGYEERNVSPEVRELKVEIKDGDGPSTVLAKTVGKVLLGDAEGTSAQATPNPYDKPVAEAPKQELTLEAEKEPIDTPSADAPGLKQKIMAFINSDKMETPTKVAVMKEVAQAGTDSARLSAVLKHLEETYEG